MSSSFSDVNSPFYLCLLDIQLKDGGNKLNTVRRLSDMNLKTALCAKITLSTHKLHLEHQF